MCRVSLRRQVGVGFLVAVRQSSAAAAVPSRREEGASRRAQEVVLSGWDEGASDQFVPQVAVWCEGSVAPKSEHLMFDLSLLHERALHARSGFQ